MIRVGWWQILSQVRLVIKMCRTPLKPCECGGDVRMVHKLTTTVEGFWVACWWCDATTFNCPSPERAAEAWAKRDLWQTGSYRHLKEPDVLDADVLDVS